MAVGRMGNTHISQGTKPLNLHPLPCSNLLDRALLAHIFLLLLQLPNPQGLLCQSTHYLNHHKFIPKLDCSVIDLNKNLHSHRHSKSS